MTEIKARDYIAAFALAICAILLICGIDGEVKTLLGVIIGYYFHVTQNYVKTKTNHGREITPSNS